MTAPGDGRKFRAGKQQAWDELLPQLGIGDWGLGVGAWGLVIDLGLGVGGWGLVIDFFIARPDPLYTVGDVDFEGGP